MFGIQLQAFLDMWYLSFVDELHTDLYMLHRYHEMWRRKEMELERMSNYTVIRYIPMLEDDGPVMRRSGRTRAANRSGYFRDVQEQNAVPCYKTNAETPGICLIINNRDFYKDPVKPEAKELKKRDGTNKDAFRLIDTFGNLGFKINYKENLSDTDMVNAVNQLADLDHSDYDCFVCCILSHGTEGAIYGSNGCLLDVKKFTAPFRAQSCPSLSGKPKLFFMQACQGQEKQLGCKTQIDSGIDMKVSQAEMIPNEADFLLGYATVPGFASFRSKSAGSWYITKLTEILNKYAKKEDIHSLLLLVNHEVGKENANMKDGTYKQSPALFSSLRKKLIFQ